MGLGEFLFVGGTRKTDVILILAKAIKNRCFVSSFLMSQN